MCPAPPEQPDSRLEPGRLSELFARCTAERDAFRSRGASASPACVELFRRAFEGDQEAWAAVQQIFGRQLRAWAGAQRFVDPDDVLQEALLAFSRSAPRQPTLVASDELGPLLLYLRQCVKTALLTLLRREHKVRADQPAPVELQLDRLAELSSPQNLAGEVDLRLDLHERLQALIETDQEQLVFRGYFELGMKPQEIQQHHAHRFADVGQVYTIVQRLVRRFSKDPLIQELHDARRSSRQKPAQSSSLYIASLESEEERAAMGERCSLDEAVLLDYVVGDAPAEVRAAVERSPACLGAARRLAAVILPLRSILLRAACPDAGQLVAFQEQRLGGTEQLVLRRHVAECPLCQEEISLLGAVDAAASVAPGPLRRLVEALFQPAIVLPQPARGATLRYQAPTLVLLLSARKAPGRARVWSLRGQARTPDGLQAADVVQAVVLRSLEQADDAERHGTVELLGSFLFSDLEPGSYSLSVLTADEEIVIRRIAIGDRP